MSAPTPAIKSGDRVICNPRETPAKYHGIVWTVERLLPVNVVLRPVDGGRGLRTHPSALLPAPADGDTRATTVTVPYLAPLSPGTVVTVTSTRWRGSDALHVVLDDNAATAKLALLGGDNHTVWRRVPRGWITEVDRTTLLEAVAGLMSGRA